MKRKTIGDFVSKTISKEIETRIKLFWFFLMVVFTYFYFQKNKNMFLIVILILINYFMLFEGIRGIRDKKTFGRSGIETGEAAIKTGYHYLIGFMISLLILIYFIFK